MSGTALILLFLVAPAVVAGFVSMALRPDWVVRISTWAILVQIGFALSVWLLFATLPGKENGNGDICPDFHSLQGLTFSGVAYVSIAVGGIAAGFSTVSVVRGVARVGRLLAGLAADGLVVVIWLAVLFAALCGMS